MGTCLINIQQNVQSHLSFKIVQKTEERSTAKRKVMWNETCRIGGNVFVRFGQIFLDATATTLESFATFVYPAHTVL